MRTFLLIPHLEIQNANAIGGCYTIGVPSMTAWLGAVHKLERILHDKNVNVNLSSTAISYHHVDVQIQQSWPFNLIKHYGTPLNKEGKSQPFIPEGRVHLEVSLLIELTDAKNRNEYDKVKEIVEDKLFSIKIAGGDPIRAKPLKIISLKDEDENSLRTLMSKLMLGSVLIERRDLIMNMVNDDIDPLDAIINHIAINHEIENHDDYLENDDVTWHSKKIEPGWLVPIATGFQSISEISDPLKNQRDAITPHVFAESILTLGEFVMPYRIKDINSILWQYTQTDNMYLCQTLTYSEI
jgi:CRISPR-associated protein Csy2